MKVIDRVGRWICEVMGMVSKKIKIKKNWIPWRRIDQNVEEYRDNVVQISIDEYVKYWNCIQ